MLQTSFVTPRSRCCTKNATGGIRTANSFSRHAARKRGCRQCGRISNMVDSFGSGTAQRTIITKKIYGTQTFQEALLSSRFDAFHADVASYFQDRPADLLIINLDDGFNVERLCKFVGVDAVL